MAFKSDTLMLLITLYYGTLRKTEESMSLAKICHQNSKSFEKVNLVQVCSTLEMDTFKGMSLLSYFASLDNKPRTCLLKVHFSI